METLSTPKERSLSKQKSKLDLYPELKTKNRIFSAAKPTKLMDELANQTHKSSKSRQSLKIQQNITSHP